MEASSSSGRSTHPKEQGKTIMNIDRAVLAFAGLIVLAGLVLAQIYNPWWLLLSAFAGLNMLQAAFTGFCPAAIIFKKLGVRPGNAFQ
jgi:fatty acid desaturase